MKALTCASAQRMLQAFYDRELAIPDQIAVGAHVEGCDHCAASLADLQAIGSALATLASHQQRRASLSSEEAAAFNAAVVNRLKAEQDASLVARVRDMFADIRLVYAGGGAALATVVFVMIMLGMMRFATNERPDSLAAIVSLVATPLECEPGSETLDASGCRARWEARFQRANESAEQESVFALDSAVTHQSGHLANLEVLRAGRRGAVGQAREIEALLDSVTRLRLEGALPLGAPVPGNVLWLVERATVRASVIKPPALDVAPALKKRADSFLASSAVRA